MYQKILHFIKYHNAFTIIFVMVFFGFGMSYAASPAVRESVYSSSETVVSVDNSRVVSADLDNFNFNLKINSITEDETNYYAAYSYQTLAIEDGVWQNKEIAKTLKVNKEALGGKDLGLYVAQELGENVGSEQHYLKRVQKLEKEKGDSRKIVAVKYSGLIGKFLNSKARIIDGYSPVIPESTPTPSPVILDNTIEASMGAPSPTPRPAPMTETPTPSPELTPTPSISIEPTALPSVTPEPTPESTPELTPEPTPITTPDVTVSPTPTSTPSETPTPIPTPEPTPELTLEPTPTP